MSVELTRPQGGGPLAASADADPLESFAILDVFAGGIADEAPRLDALATISAGERGPAREGGKPGLPRRSTDGTILLHDANNRAPGLAKALLATGGKCLTVAFPFDDPRLFIQQRFTRYSASALEAYGDERSIRVIGQDGMREHAAGSEGYARAVATCKVSVSVYFMLAEWGADGPAVVMPDGLGFYRLRFTSRNSLRSVVNGLRQVGRFTQGRIAGIPFDLRIDYREVSDGAGKRYTVPVWALVMRPPATFRLSSHNWGEVMRGALAQGEALQLPPPSAETLALAAYEGDVADLDEPSDAEIADLAAGGTCDAEHWKKRWGAVVDGTRFDDSRERRKFIRHFTRGRFASLKDFLAVATEGDAEALIAEVQREIAADRSEAESAETCGACGARNGLGEPHDRDCPAHLMAADDEEEAELEADAAAIEAEYAEVEEDWGEDEPPAGAPAAAPAPPATPAKRWSQRELNRFFAQLQPLRPRPTPADIHRILQVQHIQEVPDLEAALGALFEAWRREHAATGAAAGPGGEAGEVQHPEGSIEAAWQRYRAARASAELWNKNNPGAAIRIAPAQPENEATVAQVNAYAKNLENQVVSAVAPFAAGGGA